MSDQDQEAAGDAGDITEGADGAESLASAKKASNKTKKASDKTEEASDKTEDLDKTRDALVEAAAVSSGLWITYLGVLLYLLIAVGSVTHKDLFLESPITLPLVSVKLPLAGFFVLGPGLFLIVHAYVLLHFAMLADKIAAFDELLGKKITPEAQATLRRRLPANVFVQFLAGPPKVRDGLIGLFLWLIALITLVAGPILLLLFFELQFLPYHDEIISWWQRIAVGIDLGLLWLLWPRIAVRNADPALRWRFRIAHAIQSAGTIGIMLALTLGAVPLMLLIATFPGERLEMMTRDWGKIPGRTWLVEGHVDEKTRRPDSLFSNRLVLPGLDVVDHAKLDTEAKITAETVTVSLRNRDLRGAVLQAAVLRKADFTGAHLEDAILDDADLRGAKLGCTSEEAWQSPLAKEENMNSDTDKLRDHISKNQKEICTHLEGASLWRAQLQAADFYDAYLQSAKLESANLQGANLRGVRLHPGRKPSDSPDNAGGAQLQGANLLKADLRGALLEDAYLIGAYLEFAQLQGADLSHAQLQGADLRSAYLQGADLSRAQLQGANLVHADLDGADFSGAQLQGAILAYLDHDGTNLCGVSIWGTVAPKNEETDANDFSGTWVCKIKENKWDQQIGAFPAATLPERIAKMTLTVPVGYRSELGKRLSESLTNKRLTGKTADGEAWRAAQQANPPEEFYKQVDKAWGDIGCEASSAPYVMQRLIPRLEILAFGPADKDQIRRAVGLAKRFQDCDGRKGLSADDLASLKKISGPADVGEIQGAHAEAQGSAPSAFLTPALPPASEKASPAPAPVFGDLSDRAKREVATPVAPDPLPRPAHHPRRVIHAAPNGNMLTLTGDTTARLNQQELARHRSVAMTSDNSISSFFRSLFH